MSRALERWTVQEAAELYSIREWSLGYFEISEAGEVCVRPKGAGSPFAVSLPKIVAGLKDRGLSLPILLRFSDILEARIASLNNAFRKAIADAGYRNEYRGVYPVKVNQQQHVVEEIAKYGRQFHHGLEVGSKAELMAALAYIEDPEAFVICNGYKDADFIQMALYAKKMGTRIIIVIEMPCEVPLVLEWAARLGVRPTLGLRVKLSSFAGGLWSESGGERSFFGLTTSEIIEVVDQLRQRDMLDCLELLHYHLGSQIPNIRNIQAAASEAARFYVDLTKEGAKMGLLDVGGGLAVDYDGSHTNFASSSNYTLDEYCADLIDVIMKVTDEAGVPHPLLISESGRATVSHHSVLLFSVLDVTRYGSRPMPARLPENAHEHLQNLLQIYRNLSSKNAQESYHDAAYYRDEIRALFMHDGISLRERACAEEIFWNILGRIAEELKERKYVPDELRDLEAAIADIYFCNFSVFQSLPDSWAIGQLFPALPIHRLNEQPTRLGTLADITCDCDGKIDKFIDLHDVKRVLPLHNFDGGEYIIGVFLVGAYQETLGDLHNLLGDTNVVGINVSDDGEMHLTREIIGDSVSDVLSYVEYEPKDMIERLRQKSELAVRENRITPPERRAIVDAYETGLRGYTYFEK